MMDEYAEYDVYHNDARTKYLVFIACAMGPFSILGSALIIFTVYRAKQIRGDKAIKTYERLLSCMAFFDILLSIALTLGPLPIPSELDFPGGHGNTGFCELQGFLFQIGLASFAYAASLMVYYVLVLCFNFREATIAKYVEPVMHAGPLMFYFSTSILGFIWEIYNPQGVRCGVGVYPPGCEDSQSDDVVCERGEEHYQVFAVYLSVNPLMFYTFVIIICLLLVIFTIVRKYRQSRRFEFEGTAPSRAQQKRMRLAVSQCLLYGFFFLNVTFWGVASSIVKSRGKYLNSADDKFWLAAISLTLFPLQGFFFFLIHIRPRYLSLREKSTIGRWGAVVRCICEPEAPARTTIASSNRRGSQEGQSEFKQSGSFDFAGGYDVMRNEEAKDEVGRVVEDSSETGRDAIERAHTSTSSTDPMGFTED